MKTRHQVSLDTQTAETAKQIGSGNLSAGIESAVNASKTVTLIVNNDQVVHLPGCIPAYRIAAYVADMIDAPVMRLEVLI
jgi:hypothetical protein